MAAADKQIFADLLLDNYRSFFDHPWAQKLMELTKDTDFFQPVFDLVCTWRGAANAHHLPYLLITSLVEYGNARNAAGKSMPEKLLDKAFDSLVADLGSELTPTQKLRMQQKLRGYLNLVEKGVESLPKIEPDEYWSKFLDSYEWQMSLWGLQRLCYCSVYFAYEHFVTSVVAILRNEDNYRAFRFKTLANDFAEMFNQELVDECLNHQNIEIARHARNCIAHNGGRINAELRALPHRFEVVDEEIHITAPDTLELTFGLKLCVEKIVLAAMARDRRQTNRLAN